MKLEDIREQLRSLRNALTAGLVERDVAVRLSLLAALAGEHLLLIGPPGTAKSLVARRLSQAFDGATRFERLLTRFTVPEELFGPLSIKALEADRYERQVDGYLPTASIAFLDEIFKANSAILNALLTLLNEREFDNGGRRTKTPLISVVGASNELPESEELEALYDRFLLRLHVGPVSTEGFRGLLVDVPDVLDDVAAKLRLDAKTLDRIRTTASVVGVPDDILALLAELRGWCAEQQIVVSDRRWRKIVRLLQTSALTNGREEVNIWDCWLVTHCVWEQPEQFDAVFDWYAQRVGHTAAMDTTRLEVVVDAWEQKLKQMQDARAQARDEEGRLLFIDEQGEHTTDSRRVYRVNRDDEAVFLAPDQWKDGRYGDVSADRTNDGDGLTERELNNVYVVTPERTVQFASWSRREAYLSDASNRYTEDREHAAVIEPARYPQSSLDSLDAALGDRLEAVSGFLAEVARRQAEVDDTVDGHLWTTNDFLEPARLNLKRTHAEVSDLLARLEKVRAAVAHLPIDTLADAIPA